MSRGMWKVVETKAGETMMAETEERRDKKGNKKEARRKEKIEKTEKTKEEKYDRCKKGWQKSGRFGMRKKKQQSQRQRLRSWFQKSSISESKSLARNSQSRCPQERFGIMQ